ncbi:MAG: SDR family oxidoreductase [Firmicutes bacterium]|nr:SDR family oxidoreductase [Bacillota bacterium]
MGNRLENKVAVIVGSTSGIGKATAELFAAEGAKVVVSGRRSEKGNAIVEDIKAKGGEAIFVRTDAYVDSDLRNLIDTAISTYGCVDVLVNVVGGSKTAMTHELTVEDWDEAARTEVRPMFVAINYILPHMMERRTGSIINISSTATWKAQKTHLLYQVGKYGVNALTRIVALEYGEYGIRCNTVSPGLTDTEIIQNLSAEQKAAFAAGIPLGRIGTALDNAYAILFFACDEGAYCSGRGIDVNGGGWL